MGKRSFSAAKLILILNAVLTFRLFAGEFELNRLDLTVDDRQHCANNVYNIRYSLSIYSIDSQTTLCFSKFYEVDGVKDKFEYKNIEFAKKISLEKFQNISRRLMSVDYDSKPPPAGGLSWVSGSLQLQRFGERLEFTFSQKPNHAEMIAIRKILAEVEASAGQQKKIQHYKLVSDLTPSQFVDINDLIRNPKLYDGKRIKTYAYYEFRIKEERSVVFPTPDKSLNYVHYGDKLSPYRAATWVAGVSAFAKKNDIDLDAPNVFPPVYAEIEGTFYTGKSGHWGLYNKRIVRLTKLKRYEKNEN